MQKEQKKIFSQKQQQSLIQNNQSNILSQEQKMKKKIQLLRGLNMNNNDIFNNKQFINNLNQIDQQSIDLKCPLCEDYFVKPITTNCGHSFCEYCLQQYFLFSKECPVQNCQKIIRNTFYTFNNVLNEYVEKFIQENHKEYIKIYLQKYQKYKKWKNQIGILKQYKAGMDLDVRDENYIWNKGKVIRIISRVGQKVKFLRIKYYTLNQQIKQQDIKANSQRLANLGFYTNREQIPKYKNSIKTIQNI